MDYRKWGQEYLREAAMLKRYLEPLRRELKRVSGQDAVLLYRRVAMLNEMYLECLHTGKELVGKGERIETRAKLKP